MALNEPEKNPVAARVEPLLRWVLYASGWWLMVIVALTCVEILGRKFFGFSLQGVDEVGGYTLGVTASVALAWALLKRGHTRVDVVLARFSPRVQSLCNLLAMITLALLSGYAFWRGLSVLAESIEFQSHSTTPMRVPLWIPQLGWLLGWGLFSAVSAAMAVHATMLFVKDRDRLNRYYGPLTVDEEIAAEIGNPVIQPEGNPGSEASRKATAIRIQDRPAEHSDRGDGHA